MENLPLIYNEITPFLRQKAERELHENEDCNPIELKELRTMLQEKKVPCCLDDDFLIWFLRCKKHDMKRAYEQVKKYSYERHNWMKYYGFMFFDEIRVPIEKGICGILPKRDSEGRAVFFLRASEWSPEVCECDTVLRAMQALVHFALQFPATQISGFSLILDCALASLDTMRFFYQYVKIVIPTLHIFPGRMQRGCFVNANSFVRGLSSLLISILPAKLKQRTSFHADAKEALPKMFSPSILPEEFGGELGPIGRVNYEWFKDFEEYVPKLRATNKYYKRKNTINFPETT